MAATYPGAVKSYTDKVDGVDYVKAADMNSVQAEVNAIETTLGANSQTSLLPASAGTYSGAGTNTTLAARVANLEAGITGNGVSSTDGSRIGYTLLANGNFTSAPGAITVAGASYVKIVVEIICPVGGGSAVTLTLSGASSVKYGYNSYAAVNTNSTVGTTLPISNGVALASNDVVVAEIHNVSQGLTGTAGGFKPVTWINGSGTGAGYIFGGSAVTSVTIAAATYPSAATYYVWGVK